MPPASEPGAPIRDAATLVLLRRTADGPQVLMGQRGAGAAFMPDKFVFPGGAVEAADHALGLEVPLDPQTARRLGLAADPALGPALCLAAVRELWEETGLAFGRPDPRAAALAQGAPPSWRRFLQAGLLPDTGALRLIFRAVTPPGRPRRFDARFFLADAAGLAGSPLDATLADGELRNLRWLDLPSARALPLPFITEVVLAEVAALAAAPAEPRPVPFFHHAADGSHFRLL